MKVYGWQYIRRECQTHTTREIVAAKSMAEVARIVGVKRPSQLFNLCDTGSEKEIQIAMSKPGVVFWKPIDDYNGEYREAGKTDADT